MGTALKSYTQATDVRRCITQHKDNVDYWILVKTLLMDEQHMHSPREYDRESAKIIKRIRRNAKAAQRLQRKYDRLMARYAKHTDIKGVS